MGVPAVIADAVGIAQSFIDIADTVGRDVTADIGAAAEAIAAALAIHAAEGAFAGIDIAAAVADLGLGVHFGILAKTIYHPDVSSWRCKMGNDWRPLLDTDGSTLNGIDGRPGLRAQKQDGSYIGADFIRMQPGSAFPFHTHEGDHVLYILAGAGFVHINGEISSVDVGSLIHIEAHRPHGVSVAASAQASLVFIAIGHPHKSLYALDRMRRVEPAAAASGK